MADVAGRASMDPVTAEDAMKLALIVALLILAMLTGCKPGTPQRPTEAATSAGKAEVDRVIRVWLDSASRGRTGDAWDAVDLELGKLQIRLEPGRTKSWDASPYSSHLELRATWQREYDAGAAKELRARQATENARERLEQLQGDHARLSSRDRWNMMLAVLEEEEARIERRDVVHGQK